MAVAHVHKDPDNLTLTVTANFDVAVERAWRLWEDPRQLERWWGPPTYPATVTHHDLTPGGGAAYYMTGPDGDRHHGWWRVIGVEAPRLLEFEDGFANDDGTPNADMPATVTRVTLDEVAGGTQMTIVTTFASTDDMERLVAMGMEEGITLAIGQIDDLLAEDVPA